MSIDLILKDNNIYPDFSEISDLYPEKCFYLDYVPRLIRGVDSYNQVELIYADNKREYKNEMSKIKKIIRILWAYYNVNVRTTLFDQNINIYSGVLTKKRFQLLNKIVAEKDAYRLSKELKKLEILIDLGLMDNLFSVLVFKDIDTMFWLNGLIVPLYIGDEKAIAFLEKICTTEGIYLRRFEKYQQGVTAKL
ncbi:hypothetical protein GTO91_12140 [Heliobacterium undosum]|uniref:Uncharacterized protein n=1 Tax=Heliomicrobium undosum TaxID=121734 RepID=A0A845L2I0_9FIRM|nr:hypothetical protein [Heliomicrobium undosum]MZP30463.1 hypothetical protein [Heliomicrobium undosum]